MNFDIRSIVIAVHAVVWINLCLMIIAWIKVVSVRKVSQYWIFSHILYGSGSLFVALRSVTSDFWSIVVANACLISAQIALQEGLERYVNSKKSYRNLTVCVFAIHMISILVFTYLWPSVNYRILMYGLSVSCILGISIRTVCLDQENIDISRRFLIFVLGFTIFAVMTRGIMAWVSDYYADLMQAGSAQFIGLLSMLLAYVSLSMSLFWLIANKIGTQMYQESMIDSLTHIGSRRALEDLVQKKRAATQQVSNIGIMMIDIDRFKEINDQYGHQAGDLYLIEFAKLANKENTHVFRYAGDEFIIVYYDIEWEHLKYKAELLREKVQEMEIAYVGDASIRTTISVGIALASIEVNWDEIFREADYALYTVKKQNGNKVGFLAEKTECVR